MMNERAEAGVFGYGSLLLKTSFEVTYGESYAGEPIEAVVPGWRRRWNAGAPNKRFFYFDEQGGLVTPRRILYLNVERTGEASEGGALNGLIYPMTLEKLAAFDRREFIYDRVEIGADLTGDRPRLPYPVYLYVAKPEAVEHPGTDARASAVRLSYLETVRRGLEARSDAFRAQYSRSTDAPPGHLVVTDFKTPDV